MSFKNMIIIILLKLDIKELYQQIEKSKLISNEFFKN